VVGETEIGKPGF